MKKNIKMLAQEAAMKIIPMVGDPEAYRQRLKDYMTGYITAYLIFLGKPRKPK